MEPIYIPHLSQRQDRTLEIIVDAPIADFETLTPVRGKIIVKHGGTFLDVSARVETIITLKCDRCLQQYNHRLVVEPQEIIWLDADASEESDRRGMEIHTEIEELVDSLPPDGHFDPNVWLYEQLCLSLPIRQLCNLDCQTAAPEFVSIESETPVKLDSRWGILEVLKNQLQE
jgi:uncharacterized protein